MKPLFKINKQNQGSPFKINKKLCYQWEPWHEMCRDESNLLLSTQHRLNFQTLCHKLRKFPFRSLLHLVGISLGTPFYPLSKSS